MPRIARTMMRYDLTSLQLFVTVAECGNLTRAAEREHLAVSAISKRVAELEAQLGAPLLQRFARGVGLTPAGQSLLHHARLILQQVRHMDTELHDYAKGIKGHVRLQVVASALMQFLPQEIESFVNRYPAVQLTVEERTGKAVVRAVADGSADVGVVFDRTPTQGLAALPYHRDRLVLAVPPGHALARRRALHFAQALAYPFVGPHADSSLADLMADAASAAGLPLRLQVRASSFDALVRLVESRLGLALLPEGAVARDVAAGRLRSVALKDAWAHRQLLLLVRDPDQVGPIARTLLDHLQRAAGTLQLTG